MEDVEINSCKEAREKGLDFYWNGTPCKWGHESLRDVRNGNCLQCEKERFDPVARAKRKVRDGYKAANFESMQRRSDKYVGHPLSEIVASRYKAMIERGTEEYWKKYPSYTGTTVCSLWKEDYDSFFEWFLENHVSLEDQIDKDILQRHTKDKVYGPDTCMMVPREVNSALWMYPENPTFPEKKYMGSYSRKVYKSVKGKPDGYRYEANFHRTENGRAKNYVGNYKTEYEAHCAWRSLKINRFIDLSKKYQDDYPKMSNEIKSIALEMCIDASLDRPTEWPH